MDAAEPVEPSAPSAERLPGWLWAGLIGLVILRVAYHAAYLTEVPFALATFSDGRLYEEAALDILDAPPWGTEPFYLQGLYAYVLALPMTIRPWISFGVVLQLVLAGLGLWALFVAMARRLGRREAGLGLAVLLLYPGLAFYENKVLTASLAVVTMALMLLALARLQRRPRPGAVVLLGVATGLAVLARGNMLVAVPGVAVAAVLVWRSSARRWWHALAWLSLGLLLSLGPMALRNAIVTGHASILPVHGGGTSFYIGNNRHAHGVWNDAGGLLTGEVLHERRELAIALSVPDGPAAEQAAAIGRALYRRAGEEIAQDPVRWLRLEGAKLWLMLGNDELSQDYDVEGERELLPWWVGWGLPLSVLIGIALAGLVAVVRRVRADPVQRAAWRPWAWMLGAQVLAVVVANVAFFTSAQHRLPLVVPMAMLLGPGVVWLGQGWRRLQDRRPWALSWALVALVVVQGIWPRAQTQGPSAVHYYNLAIAYVRLGQPHRAISALDRAIAQRPEHPVILIERITLHRRSGSLEIAAMDLERLEGVPDVPQWIRVRAADERIRVRALQRVAARSE